MRRRLNILIVTTLAAVGLCLAARTVAARPDDALTPPSTTDARPKAEAKAKAKAKSAPAPAEGDPAGTPPAELPADFGSQAVQPSDLGPEPTPYPPARPEVVPGAALPPAPPLPAPSDLAVEPAQAAGTPAAARAAQAPAPAPAADEGPLPPAAERPGHAAPAVSLGGAPKETEPSFVLPAERLQLGRQSVGLTLDVIAPAVLNINQTATLKVVVKNQGANDALGVVVRDELPPTLAFVASQPEAQRIDSLLSWNLGNLPPGTERVISLTVKPTKVGPFDHAATVSMMAGGKSRTMVREPKLKVEQSVTPDKVLKGQPVQFKIVVSNPGDGPARNVTVQAKLSPGLRHESGEPNDQNLFEQTIDLIGPGDRVALDTLVADTVLEGDQACVVVAQSADVVAGAADARSTKAVTVVAPRLKLTIAGPKDRYTDMLGTYEITLDNPGTAPAKNVRVLATLPVPGRLFATPSGSRWDPQTRRLIWTRAQLDPGEKAVLSFQVRMGGVGLYQVAAECRADNVLADTGMIATDVTGLADVSFDVSEKRRVVDVEGETTYVVKVVNSGTKEATRLLISAVLSDNIEPGPTSGTDEAAKYNPAERKIVFPPIDRLGPGKSMELGIKVKAVKPGIATCRVFLTHEDLSEKLDDVAAFKVMPLRR